MMSSEESSEEGVEILKIKKPPWRKPVIDDMFKRLDSVSHYLKSPQARIQMKRRVLGEVSNRATAEDAPKLAVIN